MRMPEIRIACPDWVEEAVDWDATYGDDEARMRVALACARENVLRDTGGPFGAAVFNDAGRLVAVGVNLVVPLNNSSLHAEIVAFMMAQAALGSFTLGSSDLSAHEIHTSCEPCAMCLGAVLWSGVRRVVWSATRADADRISFDEGPVFAASYDYLRARGIEFRGGVLRAEGQGVLNLYGERGGTIYNA
ncbi:MAG TPA: nucleoside deaminase [Longimicrobiales bacterium]|nr:nucleoside deaminase [Longimicrobiales bacterium]